MQTLHPIPTRRLAFLTVCILAVLCGLVMSRSSGIDAASGNTNVVVDREGFYVGFRSSLAIDAGGIPVISYDDFSDHDLKVVRCADANCTLREQMTTPDKGGVSFTSLALDALGNPVIAYYKSGDLKVMHCGDLACEAGNTIAAPDTAGVVGQYPSLVLNPSGNPVVSYYDATNGDLKVLHCGDATCETGNTVVTPDSVGDVGRYTSLALDASGNPVVAYYDDDNRDLKVLHCADPACIAGSATAPDTVNSVGEHTSLALDSTGYPVVSYYDASNANLKVLHCGDPLCASAGTITSPDAAGQVGQYNSLELDAVGNPVVSYWDSSGGTLNLLHCGDASCSSANSIAESASASGGHTSLALDSAGRPVVS